jgi:hypothetical protein
MAAGLENGLNGICLHFGHGGSKAGVGRSFEKVACAFFLSSACHDCNCAVVGEIKKKRYVYYHCTGYADKCQGNPATCRRK